MAKAKNPDDITPTPRKRTSKTLQAVPDVKKNVIPINIEEQIRARAYELWEERGRIAGFESQDWITAEREVLSRYQSQTA